MVENNYNNSDLTLLVCNYGTPDLVVNLLRSVKETCAELPKVLILNTKADDKYDNELLRCGASNVFLSDTPHGEAVDIGFEFVTTRYVLLLDSDVILKKDFKVPFEKFKENGLTLMGEISGDRGGKSLYIRVNPWFCFIDLDNIRKHGIKFYDKERTMESKKTAKVYDIGATMYEDVVNSYLIIGDMTLENKYFKHYEGMSWRVQKYNPTQGDTDIDDGGTHPHRMLWEIGMKVRYEYQQETEYLKDVDIRGVFI